jgi:hypothetical protein
MDVQGVHVGPLGRFLLWIMEKLFGVGVDDHDDEDYYN